MNKLTKILVVVVLATFSFQSFAQTFGVKAGLNMSKITEMKDAKMLLGFHVGATAELDVAEQFSVETGLILGSKGVKMEETFSEQEDDFKMSLTATIKMVPMYLEIPVNGKYNIDLNGKKLYLSAGPYLAFGIAGKLKVAAEMEVSGNVPDGFEKPGSKDVDENIKWGNDEEEDDFKRMDFGINVGAGLDIGSIGIGVQYGLGLSQLSPGDPKEKYNNRVLSVSLSYKFAK